jgi:hypothetical protein
MALNPAPPPPPPGPPGHDRPLPPSASPLGQRFDFGRLFFSAEQGKASGHEWAVLPRAWFESWKAFTGYDEGADQAAWSRVFRSNPADPSLDVTPESDVVVRIWAEAQIPLPSAAAAPSMAEAPGMIATAALLADGSEAGVDSIGLNGPRVMPALTENDFMLVPAFNFDMLATWHGKSGPKITRYAVPSGEFTGPENARRPIFTIDVYPELQRYTSASATVVRNEASAAAAELCNASACSHCQKPGSQLLKCTRCKVRLRRKIDDDPLALESNLPIPPLSLPFSSSRAPHPLFPRRFLSLRDTAIRRAKSLRGMQATRPNASPWRKLPARWTRLSTSAARAFRTWATRAL